MLEPLEGDPSALLEEGDAGIELFGDPARPLDHLAEVVASVVGGKAEILQMAQLLIDLAGLEHDPADAGVVAALREERVEFTSRR